MESKGQSFEWLCEREGAREEKRNATQWQTLYLYADNVGTGCESKDLSFDKSL